MRPARPPLVLAVLLLPAFAAPRRGRAQETGVPPDIQGAEAAIDVDAAPRPTARATRATGPVRVDGRLDEGAWEAADVMDGFVQSQPDAGMPATEPSEVRIVYDDEALYVGALLHDSRPRAYVVRSLEHDFPGLSTRDGDIFGITLDTFLDRRDSFIWLVNPFGAYRDGQTFDDSRNVDFGWDGVVQVRTRIHDEGWTVEMAIPWSTLRFDPAEGEQAWGVNLIRRVRRKNEDSYWAPLDRRDPVHRMSRAGTLEGLVGLGGGGANVSVKPYALARRSRGSLVSGGNDAEVGGDLKWGITPTLTLDATVNTDFSQVEVDEERANLTRFPLFFPEQRGFFLENSGSFTFGDVTERNYRTGATLRDFTLFHSRRVGLVDGRPVPIVGGLRLSGQAAGTEIGVLDVQTADGDLGPGENFAVLRARRPVPGGGDVGAMLVNRAVTSGGGASAQSWGVDANLHLFEHLIVNSYVARSESPGPEGGDPWAARASAAWRDRTWNVSALVRHVGEAFAPPVGFVRRTGIRQMYATVGTHRRPSLPLVHEVAPYVEVDHLTDPDGRLVTRRRRGGLDLDFLDGGRLAASVTERMELLDAPFSLTDEAVVPAGRHRFVEGRLSYTASAGRALSGEVAVQGGGYFNGDRRSLDLVGRLQPGARLAMDVSASFNRIDLPGAPTSEIDVYGARVKYGFSTRAFAGAYVQWNRDTDEVVGNLRFNWIHSPLSDLFLVLTERRALGTPGGDEVLQRQVTLKATRYVGF